MLMMDFYKLPILGILGMMMFVLAASIIASLVIKPKRPLAG